ncbi:MAG: GNAT family N-acetyltransferase [Acidimicrobiales bacterium]
MVHEISTERLLLRPMVSSDVDLLIELDSDGEVMRYITGKPSNPDDVRGELVASLGTRWLVFDDSGSFLGWVGAVPSADGDEYDIGWRFRRTSWGNGFATEAARALVDALFSAGATRVFAQTMAVNQRSRSVMERVGLRYARTFHLDFEDPLPGTELGEVEYELTRQTWGTAEST